MPNPGSSDTELLKRMALGDEQAFRDVYRRCSAPIYRYALQMSGSASLAEDVTQEVFLFLLRNPGRFDASRGALLPYLLGVGRNFVLQRLEKEQKFVPLPDASGGLPEEAKDRALGRLSKSALDFDRREAISFVRNAIGNLPPAYREVVVLCELQGMSYEEAGAVIGCAVGTVRSRLHRARALLARKLRILRESANASVKVQGRSS